MPDPSIPAERRTERDFDIVILGRSGLTGTLAARYLQASAAQDRSLC